MGIRVQAHFNTRGSLDRTMLTDRKSLADVLSGGLQSAFGFIVSSVLLPWFMKLLK